MFLKQGEILFIETVIFNVFYYLVQTLCKTVIIVELLDTHAQALFTPYLIISANTEISRNELFIRESWGKLLVRDKLLVETNKITKNRVAAAQGEQGIWMFVFSYRENRELT